MAEEANLLVAPQKNKLEGKNLVEESHPRRVSLGSLHKLHTPTPNYKQDVSPRYLRASTGSCHDYCKYGRRVTDEPKPWRSLTKRNGKPPAGVLVSKKPPVSVERKRAVSMKHVHATNVHSGGLNVSSDDVTVSDGKPEIIKGEGLSSHQKVELSSNGLETRNLMLGTVMKSCDTSTHSLSMVQPKLIPMQSAPSDASERKLGRSTRNGDAKNVKSLMKSKSLSSVDASQGKLLRRRNSIITDYKTSEASKSSLKNVMAHSNNSKLSPSSVCKTRNANADRTRKLVQKASGTKSKYENLHVIKTVTRSNLAESSVNGDGLVSVPDLEISSPKSLPGPLSSHGCNQVGDEKIDVEAKGNDDGAALTINKTSMKQNGKEIEKGNLARKSQRKGVVLSKDNDSSLRELKFRRGRTIELQPDNNGPRKLKFRGAKVQPVNQDGKADLTKNLKKKTITNKLGVNQKSRKVVLRHRGMDDKKDAQGLFNNVIEETASELVKSRKSKVKALVGAFETVISLQDSKPAS